jgi:hypothetical protein
MSPEIKECQNCKADFTIEPGDFAFYKKIGVPPPTWCWRCRAMRRMASRNMRHLYSRTCDATGEKIFTLVPPDNSVPVYNRKYWSSDKWDALEYGRDYDFSRPFFEQIKELYYEVPWGILWSMEMVNSDYSVTAFSKNCYLCFDSGYSEDSGYSVTLQRSKRCFDGVNINKCELCYYCINTNNSYKTFFSRNCTSCNEVWFSQDCVGCNNCFGCSGLRNKSYQIFNKQYSREEYKVRLEKMNLGSWSGIQEARKKVWEFWEKNLVKYQHSVQAPDCIGDYLYNANELTNCFFAGDAQNLKHCQSVIYGPNKDGMDITSTEGSELCYETITGGGSVRRTVAITECFNVSDIEYSIGCRRVSDSFGCISLTDKKYCILNKQYSKEEYENMIPKIKKHMNEMPYTDALGRIYKYGEFFPPDMSYAGYSQTQAFEYFPLTEEEAKAQGFRWRVPEERRYKVTQKSTELTDNISDVEDSILGEVVQCEHNEKGGHTFGCDVDCASAFKITKQELDFYRQMNLPLPRLCFNCRHVDRITWRNVPALYPRQCMCDYKVYENSIKHSHHENGRCSNEFETSYAPERKEIVYCEQCYQAEVA